MASLDELCFACFLPVCLAGEGAIVLTPRKLNALTSEEAAETYAFIDTTLSCVSITLLYYYYHRFVANCGNSETGAVRENTYDRLEGENG